MEFLMNEYADERKWPNVPASLRYIDVRLPGTFRELVSNRGFSDDEIGRIVRCLLLDTDFFMTQRIEAEVMYYRQKLLKNNQTRLRVEALRRRRKFAVAGALSKAAEDGQRSEEASVTVTHGNSVTVTHQGSVTVTLGGGQELRHQSCESRKDTHPPYRENTQKRTSPPALEKSPLPNCQRTANGKAHVNSKLDAAASEYQGDLFSLAFERGGSGASAGLLETAQGRPPAPLQSPGGTDGGAEVPRDPRPALEGATAKAEKKDTRIDSAWIPEKFSVFWKKYPKKVAKQDAVKAFTKLIKTQKDVDKFMATVLASIDWWMTQPTWRKDGSRFVPYPATWLNRGNWKDSEYNRGDSAVEAQFLKADAETDDELIRRMQGG